MSDTALQDTSKRESGDTTNLDLDWLTLEDGESIRWASTPHKYSLVPAFVIGIPLSLVLVGIPLLVGSYLQYTNTNYVVTNRGIYSKRGIRFRRRARAVAPPGRGRRRTTTGTGTYAVGA